MKLFIAALALISTGVNAGVYKCKVDGKTAFQQIPCPVKAETEDYNIIEESDSAKEDRRHFAGKRKAKAKAIEQARIEKEKAIKKAKFDAEMKQAKLAAAQGRARNANAVADINEANVGIAKSKIEVNKAIINSIRGR